MTVKTMKLSVAAIAMAAMVFTPSYATPYVAPESGVAVPPGGVDLTYAAERALPAVVHIKYVQTSKVKEIEVQSDPFEDFFSNPFGFFGNPGGGGTQRRQVQTPRREASGSGVIISSDGYIVTNNHVVEGADELRVTLNDNREFSARIIGNDKNTDLALIKIDGKNLPTLPIGDSDKLRVGEWVIAVGNPFNLNSTVTAGIVSAKARSLYANGVESFIQTDAAINAGNSGGALVNTSGELVGINAMLYSQTGSYSGYGFAIPTTIMNKVVDDLKKYGTVQRAILGIQGQDVHNYIDAQQSKGNDVDLGTVDGVYVAKVDESGAGAEAGLSEGDVVTMLDNKKITKMAEMQEYLASKRPGDKVKVTYLHNKKKQEKTVTLKNAQGTTNVVKTADMDVLGVNFREINDEQKKQLGINYGVEVIKVNAGRMKDEGVTKGFIIQKVNDEPIRTIDDMQQAVAKASTGKDQVLYIQGLYPTGKKKYFAVPLSE